LFAAGDLDTTFGDDGVVVDDFLFQSARDVAVAPDGSIYTAGGRYGSDWLLARFKPDGGLDTSFGDGGYVVRDVDRPDEPREFGAQAIVLQADGKILVGGSTPKAVSIVEAERFELSVQRYTADGQLDTSWGDGGTFAGHFGADAIASSELTSMALQPDGKLLIAGSSRASPCCA
jgi:uncharacterized delta-60 repeat protein